MANQIRHKQLGAKAAGEDPNALLECLNMKGDDTSPPPNGDVRLSKGEEIKPVTDSEEKFMATENIIAQAAQHVADSQTQRVSYNDLCDAAYETKDGPAIEKVVTLTADFAQKMLVPNLVGEQPGRVYYLTPMNGHVFGIANAAERPTKMSAHCYMEYDGDTGGRQVALMMWKELERMGLTQKGADTVKEINLCFDNCPSQNKNRMVLRLLPMLINRGICLKARAFFLVKGHTKNCCDRLYNLLKAYYRKANCYTPKHWYEFLETAHEVSLFCVLNVCSFCLTN
jgi:hypothetical protein